MESAKVALAASPRPKSPSRTLSPNRRLSRHRNGGAGNGTRAQPELHRRATCAPEVWTLTFPARKFWAGSSRSTGSARPRKGAGLLRWLRPDYQREGGCFGASAAGRGAIGGAAHRRRRQGAEADISRRRRGTDGGRVRGAQRRARARSTRQPSRVPSVRALKLSLPFARVLAFPRPSCLARLGHIYTADDRDYALRPGRDPLFRRGQYDGGGCLNRKNQMLCQLISEFPSHGARSVLGFQIEAGRLCAVSGRGAGDLNVTAEEARIGEPMVVESRDREQPRDASSGGLRIFLFQSAVTH